MIVITVARKPITGTVVDNIQQWGTGGLNIGECRIASNPGEYDIRHYTNEGCFTSVGKEKKSKFQVKPQPSGRFPANVIFEHNPECVDNCPVRQLDVQSGILTSGGKAGKQYLWKKNHGAVTLGRTNAVTSPVYADSGGASRFFKQVKE